MRLRGREKKDFYDKKTTYLQSVEEKLRVFFGGLSEEKITEFENIIEYMNSNWDDRLDNDTEIYCGCVNDYECCYMCTTHLLLLYIKTDKELKKEF